VILRPGKPVLPDMGFGPLEPGMSIEWPHCFFCFSDTLFVSINVLGGTALGEDGASGERPSGGGKGKGSIE
jgi:hypothetical protein